MAWEVLTMAPPYVGQVEAYTLLCASRSSRFLLEGVKTRFYQLTVFKGDGGKFAVVDVAVAQVTRGEAA